MQFLVWLKAFKPLALNIPPKEALRAACGAFFSMLLILLSSRLLLDWTAGMLLVSAFAASCVLVFLTPATPLAHPWSLLSGNLIAAGIAITAGLWVGEPVIRGASVLAGCMVGLLILRCLHPPSCALAVCISLQDPLTQQWGYALLWPVALNSLLLLGCAVAFNNATGQRYPRQPLPTGNRHHTHDLPSWQRISLQEQDLEQALDQMGRYVDVRMEDLVELLQLTEQQAFARMSSNLTAAHIMSRDVKTATPDTSMENAWAILVEHRLEALPILDDGGRLTGIVTLIDFMNQKSFARMPRRRWTMSRASRRRPLRRIMTSPVISARAEAPVLELVLQLSHNSLHHLPIVDERQQVIGIVSQTDLINGMYRLLLQRCHVQTDLAA